MDEAARDIGVTATRPPEADVGTAGLPLSGAQSGMWYAQSLDPSSPALNTAEYLEIHGPVDPVRFAEALHRTAGEADALRVRVVDGRDGPRQLPITLGPLPAVAADGTRAPAPDSGREGHRSPPVPFPLHVADLRAEPDPRAAAHRWMRADLTVLFDLEHGPLFRYALLRVGDERWWWYQAHHHVAMDGYGFSLLARRVAELYTALAAGTEPGPSPFGRLSDLVAEDLAYRDSAACRADREHWSALLADRPEATTPAGGTTRPSHGFLRHTTHLPRERTERLRELASTVRASWPDVLIAVQALYLSRVTGSDDVVLGLPMMGRMGSSALRVPGMVMNVLPLRLRVTPETTFADLTRQVVLGVRDIRRHQRYRYEDIRRDLGLLGESRTLAGTLVNVMPFDYPLSFGGHRATAHNLTTGMVDDLTVNVYDRADGAGLRIDHDGNPALYSARELGRHQQRFVRLLSRIGEADPHAPLGGHPVLTEREQERVLREFNDTAHPVPATTLIGPIEARAARRPSATAVVFGAERLTYGELNATANQLARHLRDLGVGPGTLVAVALPRSPRLVIALIAVLKAGGAYLPLDPDQPPDRLDQLLTDAAPVCVLTDTATRAALPAAPPDGAEPAGPPPLVLDDPAVRRKLARLPVTDPGRALTPQHPAYVIYTSGSTGRPKGVVVSHAAIDNRLRWMQAEFPLEATDRVLQKTPHGFDVSVWEFFWPLREGATLVVAEPGAHRDPNALAQVIQEQRVSTVHFVPSMLRLFLNEPAARGCAGLRRVFCSGEALGRETVDRFHTVLPGVPLHNLYGPTEAAVDVTHHPCPPGDSGPVPIGKPVWNTRLYVLDAARQPCPPKVVGELYLAGSQLADGYLGRPELTAERFVPDPFAARYGWPETRMYRTGDLARWRDDGSVEYLGRTDHQVKLRGQRLELGEVEAVLASEPTVGAACVLLREDRPGDSRLVGYLVPATGAVEGATGDLDTAAVRRHAAARLPDYMVPSALVVVAAFPLSVNGKLDRAALPAPELTVGTGQPPADHQEERLCRLFADTLGLSRIGVQDNFFDLGGNSLLGAELMARIGDVFGPRLAVGDLFRSATPIALADRLRAWADAAGEDGDPTRPADRAGSHALEALLPLRAGGTRTPLFVFPPAGGLSWCYSGLLAPLGPEQPVYGLQARGLADPDEPLPNSLAEMARDYLTRLRTVQPHGPYRLLGWSVGGVLAHTVAVLLQEAGEEVELLALMDAYPADQWRDQAGPTAADALRALLRMAGFDAGETGTLSRRAVLATLRREGSALAALSEETLTAITRVVRNNATLMREHTHRPFDGDVLFFTAAAPRDEHWLTRTAWQPYVSGRLVNRDIDCTHPRLTQPGPIGEVAGSVARWLADLPAAAPAEDRR